jgi:hypothetical protein
VGRRFKRKTRRNQSWVEVEALDFHTLEAQECSLLTVTGLLWAALVSYLIVTTPVLLWAMAHLDCRNEWQNENWISVFVRGGSPPKPYGRSDFSKGNE